MKKIMLNTNDFAIVDDEDFDRINKFKWKLQDNNYQRYARRMVWHNDIKKYEVLTMHRFILGFIFGVSSGVVDHINGDGLDNRKINLRIVTPSQNQMNSKKVKKNLSSVYKGVCLNTSCKYKKWTAQIQKDYKNYRLGYFENEFEAAKAYDNKARELFGEYVLTNEKMGLGLFQSQIKQLKVKKEK